MIKSIRLKFGRAHGTDALALDLTPLTIFVGPNNSGKSKVLAEINQYCRSGNWQPTDVLLNSIEFINNTPEEVEAILATIQLSPLPSETVYPDHIIIGKPGVRNQAFKRDVLQALQNPNSPPQRFSQFFLSYNT